jgi:hypothetical protein
MLLLPEAAFSFLPSSSSLVEYSAVEWSRVEQCTGIRPSSQLIYFLLPNTYTLCCTDLEHLHTLTLTPLLVILMHTSCIGLKEERVMLLEAWRIAERSFGSFGEVAAVEAKLPRKIKMRKMATAEVREPRPYAVCNTAYLCHAKIKIALTRTPPPPFPFTTGR